VSREILEQTAPLFYDGLIRGSSKSRRVPLLAEE